MLDERVHRGILVAVVLDVLRDDRQTALANGEVGIVLDELGQP